MFSGLIKKLLYYSGILSLFHRARNARTLTVIMFHRVLDPADSRWRDCDPAYTISAELFRQCLAFFVAHYNIVSAHEVAGARRGEVVLPPRALLITFDDGWADNVEYALPHMRELCLPGLMFVVTDAIDRHSAFYQEQIVSAWRRGTISAASLGAALQRHTSGISVAVGNELDDLRQLISQVELLSTDARLDLLRDLAEAIDHRTRQMVTHDDLHTLDQSGVTIGSHGKTHTPMTDASDLDAELAGARSTLAAMMPNRPAPIAMSFPHGRFDGSIANRAHEAGYELVFTSVPIVNRTGGTMGWLLGRVGFETDALVDHKGRFQPERMALYLFRRPHGVLA